MHVNQKAFKRIAMVLIVCMLGTILQGLSAGKVEAATADLEVMFGAGTHIGNLTYNADNSFVNIYAKTAGFTQIPTVRDEYSSIDWGAGNVYTGQEDKNTWVNFEIDIASNPTLKELAQSGHAEVVVGFASLVHQEGWTWNRPSRIWFKLDGQDILSADTSDVDDSIGARSAKAIINENSKLLITVYGDGKDGSDLTGVRGMYIKFQDKQRPTMSNYTFTGSGSERMNTNINQQELFVKKDENITLSYNFSEPVKPTALNSAYYEHFLRQPLFSNVNGTGLPGAGQAQYLENTTYNANNLKSLQKNITYQYVGGSYHSSGNQPLEPLITGTTSGGMPINQSLEEKFKGAVLADAAGNVAVTDFPAAASNSSNAYLKGRTVNPFDYSRGGYRVIVDAVAPKYTKTGNGIQPEIVTGVTLNKNDTVDFTVQLTEEAVVKEGWDVAGTFLLFNNGMKAYYVSGSNTANWTFRADITDGLDVETPLLKVIALTHDRKGDSSDTSVIQDYAGNLMIQPANYEGIHVDGDESLVNSKIDWAQLAIDNQKPIIDFLFEAGGATDESYQKTGIVTIDANDPTVKVPKLDPIEEDRGSEQPSRGIYRPSNNTGGETSSTGLVYYMWNQSPRDPLDAEAGDNFAAIKRYSLAAKQPSEQLYPGQYGTIALQVANNKTNRIAPPAEALTDANSGDWYLHTWTSDMTWDTARELMQYEKKKQFVANNPEQYEAWKQELTSGSEADRIFYADNKALAAVGSYGDVAVWPLSDFKKDDSNWTYESTVVKLDNRKPKVTINEINGDNTVDVQISAKIVDEHSGVKTVSYQWVLEGNQPQDIDWTPAILDAGGNLNISSMKDGQAADGVYRVYFKAIDNAGNEIITSTEKSVTSSSKGNVRGVFSPAADTNYVQSHAVKFTAMSIKPDSVGYAISSNLSRPGKESDYTTLSSTAATAVGYDYTIPVNTENNGIRYIHMMVKVKDQYYYFSKEYYFDNEAPLVTFSKNNVGYALESHKVTVTVSEPYSINGVVSKYQWVKIGNGAPDQESTKWQALPRNGSVEIDGQELKDNEIADYRLYVWATDGAGNQIIKSTSGIFKVLKNGSAEAPLAKSRADLLYLYGDEAEGYTAIIELILETADKQGYEYSVSTDNGESWNKWKPFTSFIAVKSDPGSDSANLNLAKLPYQLKFRTPGGTMSLPQVLNMETIFAIEPVYALTTLSTTRPISPAIGVDIEVTAPAGIQVVPSEVNPSQPEQHGSTFTVRDNGVYTFTLTDSSNAERKEMLYVVVKNIDSIAPEGSIDYLVTEKTNNDVTVKLDTSEPVQVTNNNGKSTYTFTENGTFTFEFKDEAGNTGTTTATVNNIDKEGPDVKIVRSYAYGEAGTKTFGTIVEPDGNVLFSSGVTLEVQKASEGSKNFRMVKGSSVATLQSNGIYTFVVSDEYGNTKVLTEEVNNIMTAPPQIEDITYTYVDKNGHELPADRIVMIDGKPYANANMKVTISGKTAAPNKVFSGIVPIQVNGSYTNKISDDEDNFTYSRTYSANGATTIAVSDLLGNVSRAAITVDGIDNKAPELTLNSKSIAVVKNKKSFDFRVDLGGYTVSDNVSKQDNIEVTISKLDLTQTGRQDITYTAKDQVGNTTSVVQIVYVVKDSGILIFADDILISSSAGESALFDHSTLTFSITGYNLMNVSDKELVNEAGTYDLLYQSGLYREGQMKYIASKITYKELVNGEFKVTFPGAGWYTIIVRNQEREREFATFFISKK